MDWIVQSWVWIVVFVVFIGMHLFGHGGHGGHNGHGGENQHPTDGKQLRKGRSQSHYH